MTHEPRGDDLEPELDESALADQAWVRAALAGLPAVPLPTDVAARLDAAFDDLGSDLPAAGNVTALPQRTPPAAAKWLAAAAAVALTVTGIGTALELGGRENGTRTQASDASGGQVSTVRNDTGTDYADRAALAAAVGGLLSGTAPTAPAPLALEAAPAPAAPAPGAGAPQDRSTATDLPAVPGIAAAAPDPLARLRTEAGLADCLRAVLPPEEPSAQPLALDYGSYRGTPALVIVLPAATKDNLDVYVVGARCSVADDGLLFYASVPAP